MDHYIKLYYLHIYSSVCVTDFLSIPLCAIGQTLQVDELNLADIGPKFEHHAMFPARTNTGLLLSLHGDDFGFNTYKKLFSFDISSR